MLITLASTSPWTTSVNATAKENRVLEGHGDSSIGDVVVGVSRDAVDPVIGNLLHVVELPSTAGSRRHELWVVKHCKAKHTQVSTIVIHHVKNPT